MEVKAIITDDNKIYIINSNEDERINKINNMLNMFNDILAFNYNQIENEYESYYNIKLEEIKKTIRENIQREYESKLLLEQFKNNILESEYKKNNDILTQINTNISNIVNSSTLQTITQKGIEGEEFVYNHIYERIKLNNDWSIQSIGKDMNHNSDIEVIYKNLHTVIEVKNLKAKISNSIVKKFNDVYINSVDKNYNSGIFISLISDYGPSSNVWDFCIKTINNKPVIYISMVKQNPDKIIFALEVLNHLISINKCENVSEINHLYEILSIQLKNYSNLLSHINKINNNLKEMKKEIKEYESIINKTLNLEKI